ncbi:MAG: transposase [Bacillota bacterium]
MQITQYELTIDDGMLHGLFQKDEGLASLLEAILNQMLEAQVTHHLKAVPYERSEERQGYRNGYRTREMKTRVGPLELQPHGYETGDSPRRCSGDTSAASRPCVSSDGDGAQRSEHSYGAPDHRATSWHQFLEVDGLGVT